MSPMSIDETIRNVERIYSAVTGREAPPPEPIYAPIPAEKDPVEHVEEQLTRLLEVLEAGDRSPIGNHASRPARRALPPLSVWETDSEIVLSLELPGVKREDVDVSMRGRILTVTGERAPMENARLRFTEASPGSFHRAIALPPAVTGREPAAEMHEGVLTIRLVKEVQAETSRTVRVN